MNIAEDIDQDVPESTFLVGGAVRDKVMDREPNDFDFVVVGVSPDEMEERGFQKIEASFPVFLDDKGREFALARTEQKIGNGYKGFEVFTGKDISLREDLERRDFTMNAMAMNRDGKIIDPFDGQRDIERGIVRHVSDAFSEDPLRVIRLARFTARFDFEPAKETIELAREVVNELTEIPEERIFEEFRKAMRQADSPRKFFEVLEETGAFKEFMPEAQEMTEVPAGPEEFHGDNSVFEHTMNMVEEMFNVRGNDEFALMSAFFHDIGKIATPDDELPRHLKHESRGLDTFDEITDRLTFTNRHERIIRAVIENHMRVTRFTEMRDSTQVKFVERMDKRDDDRLELLRDVMVADSRATANVEEIDTTEFNERVEEIREVIDEVDGNDVVEQFPHLEGKQIHDQLTHMRTERLRKTSE